MNELKRLLAEINNIKLHINNNIKQYIYTNGFTKLQRTFMVTPNH